MSRKYVELMERIAKVIENKTISLPPKKARDYEKGDYTPMFSLINRKGELLCMWCSNRKKDDVEIARFRNIEEGFDVEPKSPQSWDAVTLKVMHSLGLEL